MRSTWDSEASEGGAESVSEDWANDVWVVGFGLAEDNSIKTYEKEGETNRTCTIRVEGNPSALET